MCRCLVDCWQAFLHERGSWIFTRGVREPGGLSLEARQAVPPARGRPGAPWASGCSPAAVRSPAASDCVRCCLGSCSAPPCGHGKGGTCGRGLGWWQRFWALHGPSCSSRTFHDLFFSSRETSGLSLGLTVVSLSRVRYYNWTTAAPLLLAMQAFQKPLPKVSVSTRRKGR